MPIFEQLLSNPLLLLLLCLASFIVGLSKGGLPGVGMISVPLLTLFMHPIHAAILLLPIYILSDIAGIYLYRSQFSKANLLILIPAGLVGVFIGWVTATAVSAAVVSFLIGLLGIVFCLNQWSHNLLHKKHPRKAKPPSSLSGIFWGTMSGFTSFISHAGAPPYQVYMLPQRLPKLIFAGTTTLLFAVINFAKIIPYATIQPYTWNELKIAGVVLPLAVLGAVLGKHLIQTLNDSLFYLLVQIALFLISLKLILDSVGIG